MDSEERLPRPVPAGRAPGGLGSRRPESLAHSSEQGLPPSRMHVLGRAKEFGHHPASRASGMWISDKSCSSSSQGGRGFLAGERWTPGPQALAGLCCVTGLMCPRAQPGKCLLPPLPSGCAASGPVGSGVVANVQAADSRRLVAFSVGADVLQRRGGCWPEYSWGPAGRAAELAKQTDVREGHRLSAGQVPFLGVGRWEHSFSKQGARGQAGARPQSPRGPRGQTTGVKLR